MISFRKISSYFYVQGGVVLTPRLNSILFLPLLLPPFLPFPPSLKGDWGVVSFSFVAFHFISPRLPILHLSPES